MEDMRSLVKIEEQMEDKFTTTQRLEIKVNSLTSIVTFALETMDQHQAFIEKLKYQVDYL
jgi:hypothetical protein